MRRLIIVLLVTVWLGVQLVHAQGEDSGNSGVQITSPLPVSVIGGVIEIEGTITVTGLDRYFLEYRRLAAYDADPDAVYDWELVQGQDLNLNDRAADNEVLSEWATLVGNNDIPDGVYALRLRVVLTDGSEIIDVVEPIRIANLSPGAIPDNPVVQAATTGNTLQVVVESANVRTGDSRNHPIITFLRRDAVAPILAISNTGSGWFLISLPDGREGWISPTTVTTDAELGLLPRQAPPPVPAQSINPAPTVAPGVAATTPPATSGTQALTVRTICDPSRAYSGAFMINNPNPFEVPVSYRLSTGASGFVFARPGGDTNVDIALFEGQVDFSFTIDWGSGNAVASSRCGQ